MLQWSLKVQMPELKKNSVENRGAEIAGFRIPNHIECDEAIVSHDFREDYKFLLNKNQGMTH